MQGELTQDEARKLAAFTLGFFLGLVLLALVEGLVEEWIIAGDLADRRRVREIVKEELARLAGEEFPHQAQDEGSTAEELPSLTPGKA